MVPDDLAYQHFLLAFSIPASAGALEQKRQDAQLESLGLNPDEKAGLRRELALFRSQWEELNQRWALAGSQAQVDVQSQILAEVKKQRSSLSASAMARIRRFLTPESAEKLDRHIQTRVKSRIIIYGNSN